MMGKCRPSGLLPALLSVALLLVPAGLLCQRVAAGTDAVRQVARVALNSSGPGLAEDPALVRLPETHRPDRPRSWAADRRGPARLASALSAFGSRTGLEPSAESGLGWVEEVPVLPSGLHGEVRTLTRQVREIGDCLFGTDGMVSMGTVEETGQPRLRLNLQYEPEPGLRLTLLTG